MRKDSPDHPVARILGFGMRFSAPDTYKRCATVHVAQFVDHLSIAMQHTAKISTHLPKSAVRWRGNAIARAELSVF